MVIWEMVILAVWWPPLVLTITGILPWRWLLCWYVIFTGTTFVNRFRMLAAHRFVSDGKIQDHLAQFRDSIDIPGAWWTELWAPLGLRYHALHHLFPTLPFHNMGTAYRRLTAQLPVSSFYHSSRAAGLIPALGALVRAMPSLPPKVQSQGGGRTGHRR